MGSATAISSGGARAHRADDLFPARRQSWRDIPDEDSSGFEFDATNLFSINQFPGDDRWSGGPRVNAGMRGNVLMPAGSVGLQLGQEYRWTPDPIFAAGSGVGAKQSDIVGEFEVQLPPYVDLIHSFRVDEQTGTFGRNEIYLRTKWTRSRSMSDFCISTAKTTDPAPRHARGNQRPRNF